MIRTFHKYLSLAISIQLLLWTVSGIYFAFNKIELIRGEQYLLNEDVSNLDLTEIKGTFNTKSINIVKRLDKWILRLEGETQVYYRALNGEELMELNELEAIEIVRQKTSLIPLKAVKINSQSRGSEFRGRKLPLYKVSTESEDNINVYVGAMSGEIAAIRSDSWRTWDFMWGAHIIDYRDRDNIDNFLLKVLSILALISALSGIALFFKTFKRI
ncbi:MAG: hypothetical protein MK361_03575 [SAR86 cluster bacterium]|jgi:hypothetical protein|nr:hypothetical protein [SAR86 cluster bacterium]|tara:strand:+ start:258 stop:902 length:645 start_codon:yes stop_codon:yes gene_type:complete